MKLKRKLGFWGVFCLASGAMISSGLFVLPGIAFTLAGGAMVISYALAGIMVIPAMLSKAELVTAMPKSGGGYFFVERSMGALPGTLAGLSSWISVSLKAAFALIGVGAFVSLYTPGPNEWVIKAVAIGGCVVFTTINLLSVKGTGSLQVILVAVLLALLAGFICMGMTEARHMYFKGFMDKGLPAVISTAGLVFISFGGLTKVTSVAEEVRNPQRNIPMAMFAAVIIVTLLHVAAVFITVGVVPANELAGNLTPITAAARQFLPPWAVMLVSLAAILAFVTTANGGILAASRDPMAMSRDGFLPKSISNVSARFQTPHFSILLTGLFMIIVIAALSIENLVKAASAMLLMLFVMMNLSVLIMRSSKLQNYRPTFRSPFYPWMQIAGIVMYLFLIAQMGTVPLLTTAAFAAFGVVWYLLYVRPRSERESAFVYMVKKAVSRNIYRSELEEELKEIAIARDDVVADRFDRIIAKCSILDIDDFMESAEAFELASKSLAPRLGMETDELVKLFSEREEQSSTVIEPGLAIPHIIIPGEHTFDVLMIRSINGIWFPQQSEPVKMAFVLAGTVDERNFHLRALMAIAHIVQERDFKTRWLKAPKAEHLRDLVLLAGRRRND